MSLQSQLAALITAVGADIKALQNGKQPLDTDLTAIAALTSAADRNLYSTGAGTWALTALTAAGRALIDDVDAPAMRTTLGIPAAVGGSEWTVVTKAADESVNAISMQDDDHLFFTTVAGAMYEIDFMLLYGNPGGAGTPDINFSFGEDATIRGAFTNAGGISAADAISTAGALSNQGGSAAFGTAAANRPVRIIGCHVGNGGVFRLRWAQGTSTPANATILRAGSIMRYRRVV